MFGDEDLGGRIYGLCEGTVFDNVDPQRRGRVRVTIPGLVDQPATAWAESRGGRGRPRGLFQVPPVGAPVYVQFLYGDPDRPVWEPGNFPDDGTASTPTDAQGLNKDDLGQVLAFETERWAITVDDRAAQPLLVVKDKVSGDVVEFDGLKQGLRIKGTYLVSIEADGAIRLRAPSVYINGRLVAATKKPL